MANTVGLTALNKTVSSALDIDYPITPASVGAVSFGGTDEVNVYYNRGNQTISASLNGGLIYNDIYTGIDLDLKPAEFSDTPSETSISGATFTNEASYNETLPLLEHRYTFQAGTSVDSGSGTLASGTDSGALIYSNGTVISDSSASSILMTTSLTPKTIKAHIRRVASGGFDKYVIGTSGLFGSVVVDSSDNLKVVIDNVGTLSTNTTYVNSSSHTHAVVVRDTGTALELYYDGLMVFTTPTYTPTALTGYRLFRKFDDTGQSASVIEVSSFSVDGTTVYSVPNVVQDYVDLLKSGKGQHQYTDNNGSSKVVTVKTIAGNFQTTQDAVDGLTEGNETIVVYDGISPTPAVGLPANAQVIDLAVSAAPATYMWKTWPYGVETSVGIASSGSLAVTNSKFIDVLTSISGLGVLSAATIVPVAGSAYVKASIVGTGTQTSTIYKESPQSPLVDGLGSLTTVPSKSFEVPSTSISGTGLLVTMPEKSVSVVSTMTSSGSITAFISYTRYSKASLTGSGLLVPNIYKGSPQGLTVAGVGLVDTTPTKSVDVTTTTTGIGTVTETVGKAVERILTESGTGSVISTSGKSISVTIDETSSGLTSALISVTRMPDVSVTGEGTLTGFITPEKFISASTVGLGSLVTHLSEPFYQSIFFNGYYDVNVDYTFKL